MHYAAFHTGAPIGAVTRALDELARAGFTLRHLTVTEVENGAEVRIGFDGSGTVEAQSFVARLNRTPGIYLIDEICAEVTRG